MAEHTKPRKEQCNAENRKTLWSGKYLCFSNKKVKSSQRQCCRLNCFRFTQELLESINTLKAEEWDTNSLQIVAKEDVNPASTLPSMLPLLRASVDEDDSAQMTCNWIQRDNEDSSGDILPDINAETILDIHRTDQQTSAFPSGYTTMEMFQQGVPQPANTSVTEESKPAGTDFTVMKAGQDYIRHIIASPMLDIEGTSTILWKRFGRVKKSGPSQLLSMNVWIIWILWQSSGCRGSPWEAVGLFACVPRQHHEFI